MRGTPVLLSASVSDNFGNSPQIAALRRSREIDQSTQRFYVGWFHVGWQGIGDQSDVVTQNAWFRCALCAAISGEISILIQTGAESWGRFPVPRICRWESKSFDENFFLSNNKEFVHCMRITKEHHIRNEWGIFFFGLGFYFSFAYILLKNKEQQ